MKKTLLAISLSCLLAACGSDSSDDSSNPPSSSLKTGVLTDGPVSNVRYETSSGVKGSTNAKGEFQYNSGDSVTFYLGDIKLGSAAAQAHITPIELSANESVRTNLLILLQSLDSDHNHSNGITISDAVIAVLKDKTINLSLPTASFVQDASLLQVLQNSGLTLVSEDTAKSNFFNSFIQDSTGAWLYEDKANNIKVVLYIEGKAPNSSDLNAFNFTFGQIGAADDSGQSGIEQGQLSWNAVNGNLSRTQDFEVDTNGEWGFSNPSAAASLQYGPTADTLVFKEGDQSFSFKRVNNTSGSLAGSWQSDSQLATFFSDGSYIHIETAGNDCSSPGIESGTYTAANGSLKAASVAYDTNGCAGLVDSSYNPPSLDTFSYVINGSTAAIQYENEDPRIFTRF
ncbi:hypothetical protein [Acinetobacter sp. CWB-B33]|uniref:hypothetical protein n=1 Tax=Acinetobacter sp. CWB-B33 TaxID=2815724 RepID=UPI0031FED928